jgi:citronellol/citronellal dehydrogenase
VGVLDGRVAIVTGASRGIGAAIAERFAQEGAAVVVTARTEDPMPGRLPGTIHETVEGIRAQGGNAVAIAADLSVSADRVRLVRRAEEALGSADILVNNAAVTWFLPSVDFPDSKRLVMFEVQVHAPFVLAQLVAPGMHRMKRGWILNISSGAARHPQGPPFPVRLSGSMYGMCKAALERLTTGLAAELYEDGIAVNALSPTAVVETPGVIHHQPSARFDMSATVTLDSVAEAALVLCSGDPKRLTGRIAYSEEVLEEYGRQRSNVNRALQTVLFADIVSSTQRAAALGDRRWSELLDVHDGFAARVVSQNQGSLVKSTGDGVLATFDSPARAIRCATEFVRGAAQLGLDVRTGIHTGEIELRGNDVAGIAVHLAHRVSLLADPRQTLVSRTVVDLVFGSDVRFSEAGVHELKGIPGRWEVFAVDD